VNRADTTRHEMRTSSATENLAKIRRFVRRAAEERDVPEKIVEQMILAVDEAASNIIRHAYRHDPGGEILIAAAFEDDRWIVTLRDRGVGFDPNNVRRPDMATYLKERRVGGLGLHLIRKLMDEVDYESGGDDYNQLTLTKNIAG
jgi:serine/threonine-protein kinase RsbW